jgi:hypothetical protein
MADPGGPILMRLKNLGAADVARAASQIVQLHSLFLATSYVRKSVGPVEWVTFGAPRAQTKLPSGVS